MSWCTDCAALGCGCLSCCFLTQSIKYFIYYATRQIYQLFVDVYKYCDNDNKLIMANQFDDTRSLGLTNRKILDDVVVVVVVVGKFDAFVFDDDVSCRAFPLVACVSRHLSSSRLASIFPLDSVIRVKVEI